jgi:hypothetical protein
VLVVVAGSFSAIGAGSCFFLARPEPGTRSRRWCCLRRAAQTSCRVIYAGAAGPVSRGVALLWLLSLAAAVAAAKLGLG